MCDLQLLACTFGDSILFPRIPSFTVLFFPAERNVVFFAHSCLLNRASLQAPPSGALFTLALARKMIDRHPECVPLISSNANTKARGTKAQSMSSGYAGGGSSSSSGGGGASAIVENSERFVDEFDPASETSQGANALKTSLWELAALQKHYHPSVATLVRRDEQLLFGYNSCSVVVTVTQPFLFLWRSGWRMGDHRITSGSTY